MRTLYVLRHAKSGWGAGGTPDHERRLNDEGRHAGELLAGHFDSAGIRPQLVLCSSALRARETLDIVARGFRGDAEVRVDDRLYGATVEDVVELVSELPNDVERVLLVGHNPTVQDFVSSLATGEEATAAYPSGALATLTLDGSWRELGPGALRLTAFVRPRDLS